MPARQHRDREVEAHDRVHREHQRRRDAGEQQVRGLVALPVLGRAAPAERQHAVDTRARTRLRAIAQRGHVGHETGEPEQRRHGAVGRDREHVPDQRAAELRPQAHRVRIREQPVDRQPRPAGVQQREHRRAGDGEQRHRLGEAVDRRAPLLAEQQQNRRDQRAGVADADPPDEVDDVEGPADGDVVAPDADAGHQQVADGHVQDHQQRRRRCRTPGTSRSACASRARRGRSSRSPTRRCARAR